MQEQKPHDAMNRLIYGKVFSGYQEEQNIPIIERQKRKEVPLDISYNHIVEDYYKVKEPLPMGGISPHIDTDGSLA